MWVEIMFRSLWIMQNHVHHDNYKASQIHIWLFKFEKYPNLSANNFTVVHAQSA